MGEVKLDPYLFFNGNAKEAMEFYKSVFGGKLDISLTDDAPDYPGKVKGQIMHAMLSGGDVRLMASDSSKASATSAKIELSLSGDDEAKLNKIFEDLSRGGKAKMPLEKQFWGDTFGTLTDKYGIDWMVNISAKKE